MMILDDLKSMVEYVQSLGDLVEEGHKNSFARVVITLATAANPENLDHTLAQVSWAGATIGYLESRWRSKERQAKAILESAQAAAAKKLRDVAKATGAKTTEKSIEEEVTIDPSVTAAVSKHSLTQEIADILQSVRYALKEHQENLRELSRNERQSARMGS